MRRGALAALALLSACHRQPAPDSASQPPVVAERYDAFFLWPGVKPPASATPRLLYLLDGEVRRRGPPGFVRLRPGTPHLPQADLWLVVRTDTLDWTPATTAAILADLARWQAAGDRLNGLQVDFDASTHGLGTYRRFLENLRALLPRPMKLSITGLMDWSAHGDPQELARLSGLVDEVVVQT